MGSFKPGSSPSDTARKWQRRLSAVKSETDTVAGRALQVLQQSADSRSFYARQISKQDSPSGKDQKLNKPRIFQGTAQTAKDSARVAFSVSAFTTGARGNAVKNVLTKVGKIADLFRKFLFVRNKKGGTSTHKLAFTQSPRLRQWAARADKGSQYLRHAIKLKGEALKRLVLAPLLGDKVRKQVMDLWIEGTRRGLRST